MALTDRLDQHIAVRYQGRLYRYADLTLGEAEQLSEEASTARLVAGLLEHAGHDPRTVKWSDIAVETVDDDLPDVFEEGCPQSGGRTMDGYVVLFARPPWHWPPDVTRRQSLRDLQLIVASYG